MIGMGRGLVSGSSTGMRIVVVELNVVQRRLSLTPAQIGSELADGLSIDKRIIDLNVTFGMGLRARARSLQAYVGSAGGWVVVTSNPLNLSNVRVLQVDIGSEGVGRVEGAPGECRTKIESGRSVTMRGGCVSNGNRVT